MIALARSPEKLLRAFTPENQNWYTASELQQVLSGVAGDFSIDSLITAAEKLLKKGFLDVRFVTPYNMPTTGFNARLTVAGRRQLINALKAS